MISSGLYVLTSDRGAPLAKLLADVEQALLGGARVLQYRHKGSDRARQEREAVALNELCRGYGVPLIVNDDPRLAAAVGAAGVHLGRNDTGLREARALLGETAIVGASCYDSLERARAAVNNGADYVAFGSIYPSPTKPDAVPCDLEVLRQARLELHAPLVAIGGITVENAAHVIEAGADLIAVVNAVMGEEDIRGAAAGFAKLFARLETRARNKRRV